MQKRRSPLLDHDDAFQNFAHGISHDLGASLRSVVQFSQLLEQRVADRLDEKERRWLDFVRQGGERAQQQIEGLRQYARLTDVLEQDACVAVDELVQDLIQQLNENKAYDNVDIALSGEFPEAMVSRKHYSMLFGNLLENACLYQPKDEQHKPEVRLSCAVDNEHICLSIEDNGIGVTENHWPEITRPYKRLVNPEDYPGIGMGLSLCQRILDIYEGSMTFSTSDLGGLAVQIHLPLVRCGGA